MLKRLLLKVKIIKFILKGGDFDMALCYVTCIQAGVRKFSQTPKPMKEKVRALLISMELEHLIEFQNILCYG